jgi:hypothetical protein
MSLGMDRCPWGGYSALRWPSTNTKKESPNGVEKVIKWELGHGRKYAGQIYVTSNTYPNPPPKPLCRPTTIGAGQATNASPSSFGRWQKLDFTKLNPWRISILIRNSDSAWKTALERSHIGSPGVHMCWEKISRSATPEHTQNRENKKDGTNLVWGR